MNNLEAIMFSIPYLPDICWLSALCFHNNFHLNHYLHDCIREKCMLSWNEYSHFVVRKLQGEKWRVTWLLSFRYGVPLGTPRLFFPLIFLPISITPLYDFRDLTSYGMIYANYTLTCWGNFLLMSDII